MKKLKLFATTMFFLMEIINFGLAKQIKNEQIPTQITSTENVKSQNLIPTILEIYENLDGKLLSSVKQSELIITGTIIKVKQFKDTKLWEAEVVVEGILKEEVKDKKIKIISQGIITEKNYTCIFMHR